MDTYILPDGIMGLGALVAVWVSLRYARQHGNWVILSWAFPLFCQSMYYFALAWNIGNLQENWPLRLSIIRTLTVAFWFFLVLYLLNGRVNQVIRISHRWAERRFFAPEKEKKPDSCT